MADKEGTDSQDEAQPQAQIDMELRDRLPGGRAVICVQQKGRSIWVASKEHVSQQARDELVDLFRRIDRDH